MKRLLLPQLHSALADKIVLLTGPRQSGKTTLAKSVSPHFDYFNYDAPEDRVLLHQKAWDRHKPVIIFDELHKMKGWKRWIKGVYDKEGITPQILITGSAKLDTYRKVGDSLAGRYFQYRLYPFDLKEVASLAPEYSLTQIYDRLWHCGGFPEPFLKGSEAYYQRWRRGHLDIILRQDLMDLQAIRDIQAIETLVQLLKKRVGSGISYAALARDLERDTNTIKRWLQLLENLYVIFRVTPYHHNIARALLKEPKYYFFDIAQAEDEGARLENLVALSLLKELHYLEDTLGDTTHLHYLRTKDGKELDFVISMNGEITHLIEVKTTDDQPAKAFQHFAPAFKNSVRQIQLVKNCKREKTFEHGLEIRELIPWLAHLDLSPATIKWTATS
jgi:predicted AAA+ superfamily ATPase